MKKILLTLFSCTILPATLLAQSNETSRSQDLETWSGLELEYEITPKLSVSLEPQLRLKENSSEIDTYFGELSGKYDLWKGFSLGAAVRFIKNNDTNGNIQGFENHLRYQFDASYKHSIDKLDLKYRFRYQNKSEIDVANSNEASIRHKLSLDYNFKNWKLDPEISGELFSSVEDSQFDKYRVTLGTSYNLGNIGKLKAFYGFENTLNTGSLKHTDIIGLSFKHTIKGRKK